MGQCTLLSKTGGTISVKGIVFSDGEWGSYGTMVESSGDSQTEAVASIAKDTSGIVLKCINAGTYARMANFLIFSGNKVDLSKFTKLVFTCSTSGVTGTYNELQIATSTDLPANDNGNLVTLSSNKNMATASTTYTVNISNIKDVYFAFRLQGFSTQAVVTLTDIHFE